MKKRILSAILMSAVILTTTACGGNTATEQPNSQQESEATSAITSTITTENQKQSEATPTTSAATTESTTEAPPKEVEKIKDYKLFQHGCLVFDINNDYHGRFCFTTHNHTKEYTQYSFSYEDFDFTRATSGKRMRAFDYKYEYEAVFPDKPISQEEMEDVFSEMKSQKYVLFDESGLPEEDFVENAQHIIVQGRYLRVRFRTCGRR